jgi:hypothetical protein
MDQKIKVNYASAEELQKIPGVGPKTAKTLVTVRQLEGSISLQFLEALIRSPINPDVLAFLDFTECRDTPIQADEETMLEIHGDVQFGSNPTKVHNAAANPGVGVQEGPVTMATVDADEVRQLIDLSKTLLAKQSVVNNPVMKPRWEQSSDSESEFPSHRLVGKSGRKSRLIRPTINRKEESSDEECGIDTPMLPVQGAPMPFVSQRDRKGYNVLKYIPKTLAYDGKSPWQSFFLKFTQYAELSGWSDTDRRRCLLQCLTENALDFGARHLRSNPELSYKKFVQKLEGRFGEMLPDSARAMFYSARQKEDESLADWADRIQSLSVEAFQDLPGRYASQQTVDRFCQGLLDSEAGHSTFMQKFPSMEMAINDVRLFQHSKSNMSGESRRHQAETVYDRARVSAVQKTEGQVLELERKVSELTDKLGRFLDFQLGQESPEGAGRKSRRGCWKCGSRDHFKRNCPQRQFQQGRR